MINALERAQFYKNRVNESCAFIYPVSFCVVEDKK